MQLDNLRDARINIQGYTNRTKVLFLPMSTDEAATFFDDASVDFVYVDARHDYCGVTADLETWWPKVRGGGILAGHDFMNAADAATLTPNSDWGLCSNGERHMGAVKGAVLDFARARGLVVMTTELDHPRSWAIEKPPAESDAGDKQHRSHFVRPDRPLAAFSPPDLRDGLGLALEQGGCRVGVQLGAGGGAVAESMLQGWQSCAALHLVDAWPDTAELGRARQRLQRFRARSMVRFLPMASADAAELFGPASLDVVYADGAEGARALAQALAEWWPKLRGGGVLAGAWSLSWAGAEGAAEEAVRAFAAGEGVELHLTAEAWPGWALVKSAQPAAWTAGGVGGAGAEGGCAEAAAGEGSGLWDAAHEGVEVTLEAEPAASVRCWTLVGLYCRVLRDPVLQEYTRPGLRLLLGEERGPGAASGGEGSFRVELSILGLDHAVECGGFGLSLDAVLRARGSEGAERMGVDGVVSVCDACTAGSEDAGEAVRCVLEGRGLRFGAWRLRACLWKTEPSPAQVTCGEQAAHVRASAALRRVLRRIGESVAVELPGLRSEQEVRLGESLAVRFRLRGDRLWELRGLAPHLSVELAGGSGGGGVQAALSEEVLHGGEGLLRLRLHAGVHAVWVRVAYKEAATVVRSEEVVLRVREWRASEASSWGASRAECSNHAECAALQELGAALDAAGARWCAAGYTALALAVWGSVVLPAARETAEAPWSQRVDVALLASDFGPEVQRAVRLPAPWELSFTWGGAELWHPLLRVTVAVTLLEPPLSVAAVVYAHGLAVPTLGLASLRSVGWPCPPAARCWDGGLPSHAREGARRAAAAAGLDGSSREEADSAWGAGACAGEGCCGLAEFLRGLSCRSGGADSDAQHTGARGTT